MVTFMYDLGLKSNSGVQFWVNKQKRWQHWRLGKIVDIFTSMGDYVNPNDQTLIAERQL